MATITNTEKPIAKTSMQENPNKTLDPTFPPTVNPEPDPSPRPTEPPPLHALASDTTPATDKVAGESKGTAAMTASAEAGHDAPLSDVQKKIRRAERFGISVQLSEEEKRNSRAERFGTAGSALQSSEAPKSEELKRKARAERFGMPSPSTASDEDAKKKARLARFAPVSKTDPVEEDKRKARALRFSNPSSSSLSQVNGKGNLEPKAAIVGKSGGGT